MNLVRLAPRAGRFERAAIPHFVRDLCRLEARGTLHLQSRTHQKRVFFDKGNIVFAATNVERERLGETLVRAGRITRSVLDLSLRVMERSNERLGLTVVELGWVRPDELHRYVALQIREIVHSAFEWAEGCYRFEPDVVPVPRDVALELRTTDVVYEGALRMGDMKRVRAGVGRWDRGLVLSGRDWPSAAATDEAGYLLSLVGEYSTVGELVAASPFDEDESLRRLHALLLAGVLDLAPPGSASMRREGLPAPEQLFRATIAARRAAFQFANYYDRLGVDTGASQRDIRSAYARARRSLELGKAYGDWISDIAEHVSAVERQVSEAYEVLVDPATRKVYDATLASSSNALARAVTLGIRDATPSLVSCEPS